MKGVIHAVHSRRFPRVSASSLSLLAFPSPSHCISSRRPTISADDRSQLLAWRSSDSRAYLDDDDSPGVLVRPIGDMAADSYIPRGDDASCEADNDHILFKRTVILD